MLEPLVGEAFVHVPSAHHPREYFLLPDLRMQAREKMGIKGEEVMPKNNCNISDFYNSLQMRIITCDEVDKLCHLTSRSTVENNQNIENVCKDVKYNCWRFCIPTEGVFLRKTELSVQAFKYFICNTKFDSQSLLADDIANGHLVDMQPPFSIYLMIEITWHCNFEDILAESILHFPLDVCLQILEVLPRCIDLLNFERAAKFLTTIIPNAYKKIIILRDTGSQTEDIDQKASTFSAHAIELILQFMNSRFLKFDDVPKEEQYKRLGTLLKSIIQMVRLCLTSKGKKIEHPCEMEKLYKLTFGHAEYRKINDELLQKLLLDVDRELISLLLKKVKEIDCNIYINWTEYDDQENTAITLQRAIGLESYSFIENTKDLVSPELKDYQELVQCLGQIFSKPDNSIESMRLEDLAHAVGEGNKDCLVALFRRYKEWNDSIVDSIDSHVSLLAKDDCEAILEYISDEIVSQTHPEKLQTCLMCLSKALVFLEIADLYEITVKFVLKFGDDDNLENVIDITNFERFIGLNPDISVSKNLRVVLFFLCLKPKATLKILVKMAIGHADYPDVAVSIDDLMLLEPIMKIQTRSRDDTLIDALRHKCSETVESNHESLRLPKNKPNRPASVSFVVRILQDICLDAAEWNFGKFAGLLQALYVSCDPAEFVWEIFVPFLLSDRCTVYHLNYTLVELQKLEERFAVAGQPSLEGKFDKDTAAVVYDALVKRGIWLLKSVGISRYIVNDCLSIVQHLMDRLGSAYRELSSYPSNYYSLLTTPALGPFNEHLKNDPDNQLAHLVGQVAKCHQVMASSVFTKYPVSLVIDDVLRFVMTKSTRKKYLEHASEVITSVAVAFRHVVSKADRCDWIIRLTLETCLLCLEFPSVAPFDSVSFLLRCLVLFLSTVMGTQKKLNQKLCLSLDTHLKVFEPVAQYTAIAEAFGELVKKCEQFKSELAVKIKALETFASSCTTENDKLKTYGGINSPLGIKLYLAYDVVSMAVDEDQKCEEEYILKLGEYFKKSEIS